MAVTRIFHVMQIVDDFDPAAAFWDALMAPEVFGPKHYSDFDKRWASLASVGDDFVIEVMEPSKAEEDLEHPLPKFRSRFGAHLHSWAWFDDDLDGMIERMKGLGMRVIDPYPSGKTETIFTHPKDTMGQLEFQREGTSMAPAEGRPASWWRDEHPLHLERLSRLTTVVRDAERARTVYEQAFLARPFHSTEDDVARREFVLLGDTVVEFAQPRSEGTRLDADLARNGEIAHQVTFQVADLGAAADHVASIGAGIVDRTDDTFLIDPADSFNALLAFTTANVPGDPRDA